MKLKKTPPYEFVIEALESARPIVKPMFGGYGVYVGEKIVLIFYRRPDPTKEQWKDTGIWICTTQEHHASLKYDFPAMRSIAMFSDGGPSGWQTLPEEDPGFEEAALLVCRLILEGDPRIGKIPKPKRKTGKKIAKKTPARRKK